MLCTSKINIKFPRLEKMNMRVYKDSLWGAISKTFDFCYGKRVEYHLFVLTQSSSININDIWKKSEMT